jgi:hypothetical protein
MQEVKAQLKDIAIRALKTFVQAFLAAWAVTNFQLTKIAVLAAVAAGISAIMNLIRDLCKK